ncbi:hypothetical protein DE10444_1557 [Neisseria meningitidis]|uniref:Uncharacterized protein n=1 Tax=Neisseria meningitidis alpha522 TaxID=996307 RepID=I4E7B8_NEIME|nr:hypothetical protein DE10444_1557 [Neisseria meningitidis]CCA45236.1 hypothetical protein NMALPHA522_1695 [Neisseria meningitidis alpha522]
MYCLRLRRLVLIFVNPLYFQLKIFNILINKLIL